MTCTNINITGGSLLSFLKSGKSLLDGNTLKRFAKGISAGMLHLVRRLTFANLSSTQRESFIETLLQGTNGSYSNDLEMFYCQKTVSKLQVLNISNIHNGRFWIE